MNEPIEAGCQDGAARHAHKRPDPCVMVIFGAEGDLTNRLLTPALYNLARTNSLPDEFALVGLSRGDISSHEWRDRLHATLERFVGSRAEFSASGTDEQAWAKLAGNMTYLRGDVTQAETYERLTSELQRLEARNVIFYLAVADRFFETIVEELGAAGLTREHPHANGAPPYWRRVVIEKPFGHDLASAQLLDDRILRVLREDQIFRIDHFLGKDTVQSIMALRFANGFFEPIWNRDRIDHVQITVSETVGVEGRGNFYEATGALRDMIPNHVFSLVSMIAMEPPVGFDAKSIRAKKAEVFMAMPPVKPQEAVRGQYGAGVVMNQQKRAYRDEPRVSPTSNVETYVAMRLEIDNWRWAGVPFYIRTGKHMSQRSTEVAICFKKAPATTFQRTPVECLKPNWLVLSIAPKESISLQFDVKHPGPLVELAAVRMDFRYEDWFPKEPNVGYETLIYDIMIGDQTLFMRADMVEEAWRVVQPVLDAWGASDAEPPLYPSGQDGPAAANELLTRDGRRWRTIAPQLEAAR
jgi:glucose-6-phosphate 1-dehydrogenase